DPTPTSEKSRRELLDELYYLRDVAGEREQRIIRLEAELSRSGGEQGRRMVSLLDELEQTQATLKAMLASRSWRLTAPLRALTRWFGGREAGRAMASSSAADVPVASRKAMIASAVDATGSTGTRVESGSSPVRKLDDAPCLYVDASELVLHQGRTGIQRVVREILRALLKAPPPGYRVEPVYAAPGQPYRVARAIADGKFESGASCQSIEARSGDIFLGLDHSMEAVVERAAEFEAMRKSGVRIYFVCNDVLPLSRPDWFPPQVHDLFKAWLTTIARTADGIVCISRTTEAELRSRLEGLMVRREQPLALGHFPLGADIESGATGNSVPTEAQHEALERLRRIPSFLMVGTLEPRKGHAQALQAFELLWQRGESVAWVVVGLPGWMTDITARRIRHHDEFNKRLFWFMDADDALLKMLYGACTALLAPSEGEGFGLPLIEAARYGLPILCRDLPVFREVADGHAAYFSGLDPESLADAILDWLKQHADGTAPGSDGMQWLAWEDSARQLLEVLLGARWDEPWTASRKLPPESPGR
ncbi:MAG: glycosyltransferase, partial [Proteobacteria bacterium]|nr:glycosyltransferase [Pseudomonadota bacterium]